MAEQGKITISVGVDSGNAIDGLKDLQDGLKDMGNASGKAGQEVADSFDDIDKAAKNSAKIIDKSSATAQKAMKETAKVAERTGSQTTDALNQRDTINGLEDLQDTTGELDSSLKGLGGAVGLVSPELERLLVITGDLSGGLEASSRLAQLAGGSMRGLLVTGGALGVALGALGGAWMFFNSKVKAADERLAEAHAEMEAGIAAAKNYKEKIEALKKDVGLLSEEEANLSETRREANKFMQEEIDGNEAARTVMRWLQKDLVKLQEAEEALVLARAADGKSGIMYADGFRDIGEAIEETNEAIQEGTATSISFGRSQEWWTSKQVASGEAVAAVRAEMEKARNAIENYGSQISNTERRTNRLNLLLQIQAAQAREDNVAIRNLALGLATLGDAQATMGMLALRAAKNTAILQAQMLGLGPATGAAIAQIERMFDRLIDQTAPSSFAKTYEQLKVTIEDTSDSFEMATVDIEETAEAVDKAMKKTAESSNAGERAADLLAQARGEAAVIERDYAKAIMEVNALRVDGAITEDETTELILAAFDRRKDAIDELKRKQEELANSAKIGLEEYGKMASSVGQLTGNALALIAQDIDEREAQALAAAEGNLEKQAQIEERFNAERAAKMTQLFKLQQGAAIAGAIINGAQAAVAALAPPPVGFGPQIGMAMIPILAGIAATEVALIANQKPSFHQGGMIGGQGDQMITAQGGEAVLNKAAVAGLGGQSGVDSLNAGGAAGGAVVVQMVYKQRVLDELLVDNLAKGGPLRRAINDSSRKAKRGRIGGRL